MCGPDTIVVACANHIPADTAESPDIEPAQDVTVTVQLPEFLRTVTAFEVTADGLTDYPCRIEGSNALLKLDSIVSGRVFVLRRSQ